jgi:hypothetical protein
LAVGNVSFTDRHVATVANGSDIDPRPVISGSNMRSFMQNVVQQGPVNLKLAVVADQSQFPKLVHEEINARPGRANHFGERHRSRNWYRFRTAIAVIGQQHKSPCQSHLAGIEQLVHQVRLNSGGAGQKMVEEIVRKLCLVVEKVRQLFLL